MDRDSHHPSNMNATYVAPDHLASYAPGPHEPDTDIGAPPVGVKPTLVGPTTRARHEATGDPSHNPSAAKLAQEMGLSETGKLSWITAMRKMARGVRMELSHEEYAKNREILEMLESPRLTSDQKLAELDRLDPDKTFTRMMLERGEKDMQARNEDLAKKEMLVRSLARYRSWENEDPNGNVVYTLQKNECSRLHKLLESMHAGLFYDGDLEKFMWSSPDDRGLEDARVFVVRHDWAAAFGEDADFFNPTYPFKLPYPKCVFEFRVDDHTVIMVLQQPEGMEGVESTIACEGVEGVWFSLGTAAMESIARFCERQIRAICVALEAKVAEHEVTRAPAKLNAKRAKDKKPLLRDFHVVDLSRRIKARSRAEPRPGAQATGRRVRMHWRRGHWRHYETHTVWIEWMLCGDPDLGFIDKHYRI